MTVGNDDPIRAFLADEARRAVAAAPSLDHAVGRLAPRVEGRATGAPQRLVVLLAASLLLVATLGTAIVMGSGILRLPLVIDNPVDLGIFEPVAGRIVYGDDDGIWGLDPATPGDPAARVQLTSEAAIPLGWSSDGTGLLIMRQGRDGGQLFVLHADGSETQVTEPPMDVALGATSRGAAISPDGSRVVFTDGSALYAVDVDGGPAEVLVRARFGFLEDPTFSPDGTRIAFNDGNGDNNHHVWVMNADGTDAHEIVAQDCACHVYGLAWSPAGDRIAMGLEGTTYTFGTDGSGFRRVMSGAYPVWSPDGAQLVSREWATWHPAWTAPTQPSPIAHGPSEVPGPSAAQTPVTDFQVFPGPPEPIDAGMYRVGPRCQHEGRGFCVEFPVSISFTVPAGWLSCANNAGLLCPDVPQQRSEPDGVGGVNILIVTNVVADPCDETKLRDPSVGPTVDDLVTAISGLPWYAVTPSTDVTVDGFHGKEFEVTAPFRSPCVGTDDFATWATTLHGPDSAAGSSPGERTRLRILDVQGTRVVIAGSYLPGTTSLHDLAEIDAIIESVHFEPQGG